MEDMQGLEGGRGAEAPHSEEVLSSRASEQTTGPGHGSNATYEGPATPSPQAGIDPACAEAAYDLLREEIVGGISRLADLFADKLAYDKFKEKQITLLHDELAAHKTDLLRKATHPLIRAIIRLHDNLGRASDSLRGGSTSVNHESTELLAGFQDDIEILLGDSGVTVYREDSVAFNMRRQQALKTLPAPSPDLIGLVSQHLRPGFEQDGFVLRKELVVVYATSTTSQTPPTSETAIDPQ